MKSQTAATKATVQVAAGGAAALSTYSHALLSQLKLPRKQIIFCTNSVFCTRHLFALKAEKHSSSVTLSLFCLFSVGVWEISIHINILILCFVILYRFSKTLYQFLIISSQAKISFSESFCALFKTHDCCCTKSIADILTAKSDFWDIVVFTLYFDSFSKITLF